jgi:hypothetical protein
VKSGAGGRVVTVDEAFGAPDAMESVIHLMHRMFGTTVVGTSATDEIVSILCVVASTGVDDDRHD